MIDPAARQVLFGARTYRKWRDTPVPNSLLRELYALMKFAPTAANSNPVRLLFVRSDKAKRRLVECMAEGNRDSTRNAPVTVVIGMDLNFPEHLRQLAPHTDARSWFADDDALIHDTAFRNSSLQGAYLIMAARAIGLDCGPMSGFEADRVDEIFFEGSSTRVNFICNLGYGEPGTAYERAPRLEFDEVCAIL